MFKLLTFQNLNFNFIIIYLNLLLMFLNSNEIKNKKCQR